MAKAGSTLVRSWSERVNEELGLRERLPGHHRDYVRPAPGTFYEATRAASFVRDPFERLASGAREILKTRGGSEAKSRVAKERLNAAIGFGYRAGPAHRRGHNKDIWSNRVNAFARSLILDDLNNSLAARRGWSPVNEHVGHQAVTLAHHCPRVAYLGAMRTNKQELYQLFGRPLAEKGLRPLSARASGRPPHKFPDDLARDICRFYQVDFCCVDLAFRRRCEDLGVFCPEDMVFRPPPSPAHTH